MKQKNKHNSVGFYYHEQFLDDSNLKYSAITESNQSNILDFLQLRMFGLSFMLQTSKPKALDLFFRLRLHMYFLFSL